MQELLTWLRDSWDGRAAVATGAASSDVARALRAEGYEVVDAADAAMGTTAMSTAACISGKTRVVVYSAVRLTSRELGRVLREPSLAHRRVVCVDAEGGGVGGRTRAAVKAAPGFEIRRPAAAPVAQTPEDPASSAFDALPRRRADLTDLTACARLLSDADLVPRDESDALAEGLLRGDGTTFSTTWSKGQLRAARAAAIRRRRLGLLEARCWTAMQAGGVEIDLMWRLLEETPAAEPSPPR